MLCARKDREGLREESAALVNALPDERMQYIIRERFGKGRNLEAVGADLGITAKLARQLLQGALASPRRLVARMDSRI